MFTLQFSFFIQHLQYTLFYFLCDIIVGFYPLKLFLNPFYKIQFCLLQLVQTETT
jgi:hypothetical protein